MLDNANSRKAWPFALLALNAIGAVSYVLLASRGGWVVPQECAAGIRTITGEPFIWFGSIAPVITLYLLINLAWGGMILRHRRWNAGRIWLAAAAIWLVAIMVDFSHHQC